VEARDIVKSLALVPHPEGGWYRELHRSAQQVLTPRGARSGLTSIYYLLEHAQRSRWHTVDADEVWHFYAGAPLQLFAYDPASAKLACRILASPEAGAPVEIIPAGVWQAARSLGNYSLVGCSVGPGFEFADFRLIASLPGHEAHFSQTLRDLAHLL
jgi:predicted cupin superfamily sugar epimerase